MRTFITTVLAVFPLLAAAQGSSTGAGFLKLPLTARTAALANATVADTADFTSALLNPSLGAHGKDLEFRIGHHEWIEDISSEFFSVHFPVSPVHIGFSVAATSIPGIQIREIPGPPQGEFTSRSAVFMVTGSTKITSDVYAGASVKYLYQKIFIDETTGMGVDLGLTATSLLPGANVGLSVLNMGSLGKFRNESISLPATLYAGIGTGMDFGQILLDAFGAVSQEFRQSRTRIHGGLEGTYQSTISVRLGFVTGYETRGFSTGLGIRHDFLRFDYAFVPLSLELGQAHIATLGFQF